METPKGNLRLLTLARLFSFLGVLFLTMKTFLLVALCGSMSNGNMVVLRLSLFLSIGIILGMLLCPLFIPSPGQKKPLFAGILFILFLIVPNIALRSLGLQRWLNSDVISAFTSTLTNMLYPLCYGLFFQTYLMNISPINTHTKAQRHKEYAKLSNNVSNFAFSRLGVSNNKTGWRCVFLFAFAIAAGIAGRYGLLPALALFGITLNPSSSMALLNTVIFWLIAGTGISALVSITLLNIIHQNKREDAVSVLPTVKEGIGKTNWRMIFSLLGFSAVSKMLNSMMGIRFLPIINNSFLTEQHLILMIGGLIILGFLAGRSILIFLRWYLPFSAALFILLPCIVLFDNSSRFVLLIETILSIFANSSWAVFTAALIELYVPMRTRVNGFCFFFLTGAILLTNIFISLSPVIISYIPAGTGYTVWIIGIAAAALILLSVMALKPKQITINKYQKTNLNDIFEHRLSKRESEIAGLLVNEGLGAREIGERLFISINTVNTHIANIYRKFDVNSSKEFITRVVSGNRE